MPQQLSHVAWADNRIGKLLRKATTRSIFITNFQGCTFQIDDWSLNNCCCTSALPRAFELCWESAGEQGILLAWVRVSAAGLWATSFAVRRNQSKLPSLKPSPLRLTRGRRIETRKLTWIKACFSDLIFLWAKVYQKLWSVKPCLIFTKSSM